MYIQQKFRYGHTLRLGTIVNKTPLEVAAAGNTLEEYEYEENIKHFLLKLSSILKFLKLK